MLAQNHSKPEPRRFYTLAKMKEFHATMLAPFEELQFLIWHFGPHEALPTPLVRIYASLNRVSIGSDNGLSHAASSASRHYLNQPLGINWNINQNWKLPIHENTSENIVCEMTAILSKGRWLKYNPCVIKHFNVSFYTLVISITCL